MAEIQTGGEQGGKHSKTRAKKLSTRIDMTPMVDLAFLLLTFFMLTTTFSKPQAMEVNMPLPKPPEDQPKMVFEDSRAMTILIDKENRLFYYMGMLKPETAFEKTDYSRDGIRKLLIDKNVTVYNKIKILEKEFKEAGADGNIEDRRRELKEKINDIKKDNSNRGLLVVIKATEDASYENVVDILDEMSIASIASFALVDITPDEEEKLKTL